MEYNFSRISCDAIVGVEKKLEKVCDSVVDDINNFIHVLNDAAINERAGEMNTVIRDIMRDQVTVTVLQFTEVMNKVQKALAQYL
jgi:hypothetical protein